MSFEVHPQLAGDTRHVVSLELCELLLMNDSRFPWCILVPRLPDAQRPRDDDPLGRRRPRRGRGL